MFELEESITQTKLSNIALSDGWSYTLIVSIIRALLSSFRAKVQPKFPLLI